MTTREQISYTIQGIHTWQAARFSLTMVLCTALLVILVGWLRWPPETGDTVRDPSAAVVAYGADLLARGQQPMIHSVETMAPAGSFITWALWQLGGRSMGAVDSFGLLWTLLATLGVFALGLQLFGVASGIIAGIIFAVSSPPLDGMYLSHPSWMITPYIWATVLFASGLKTHRQGWFVGCGVMVALAALFKHQGALMLPVYVLILAWAPKLDRETRRYSLLYLLGGLALGFLPFAVYYLLNGGLGEFIKQYVFSPAGWRYLGGDGSWDSRLSRLEDGFNGFWSIAALPTLLTCLGLVSIPLRRAGGWSPTGILMAGQLVAGLFGLILGFCFIPAHYLQLLPAMALIAGHPEGPLLRWFRLQWPGGWAGINRSALVFCLLLALIPALFAQVRSIKHVQEQRTRPAPSNVEIKRIAAVIARNSKPTDAIWAWGPEAWSVYYYARRGGIRHYRSLGLITSSPAVTWRRNPAVHFVRRDPVRAISYELTRAKPRFVVLARNQAYRGFNELASLLDAHYEKVSNVVQKHFILYKLKKISLKRP